METTEKRGRRRYMVDPSAQITQRAEPIPNTACVDAKRWRCSTTPAEPLSTSMLLDNEDLLEEILLRLPPLPSALPRASLVCTRWRRILSDPQFLTRFQKHHREPPLLGFFAESTRTRYNFMPLPGMRPDDIPAVRFSVPKSSNPYNHWDFLGCRHGLAVLIHERGHMVVVWDPLTGQQHRVPFPPGLCNPKRDSVWLWQAAVLCSDTEDGHVHGDCFLSPFKLVLTCGGYTEALACLYESISGVWGDIVSTAIKDVIVKFRPSILIRNTIYLLFAQGDILAFDVERQTLCVIGKPEAARRTDWYSFQLLRIDDDCCLGFAVSSKSSIQLWKKKTNCDGVVGWVLLQKTIQLDGLFPRTMHVDHKNVAMVGSDEDSNVIVLSTYTGDFLLKLESLQFSRFTKRNCCSYKIHYPYRNFYTAGKRLGWKRVDLKL